jgi:hypothetical protein
LLNGTLVAVRLPGIDFSCLRTSHEGKGDLGIHVEGKGTYAIFAHILKPSL